METCDIFSSTKSTKKSKQQCKCCGSKACDNTTPCKAMNISVKRGQPRCCKRDTSENSLSICVDPESLKRKCRKKRERTIREERCANRKQEGEHPCDAKLKIDSDGPCKPIFHCGTKDGDFAIDDCCNKFEMNDLEDTCPKSKQNLCINYGCVDLNQSGVCTRLPSIIDHIEGCKRTFLDVIENSLCKIGKSTEPSRIIEKALRETCRRQEEKKNEDETKKGDQSEERHFDVNRRSPTINREFEIVKRLCRDDFLLGMCKKLEACGGILQSDVCGPCDIEGTVPCTENELTEATNIKDDCGGYDEDEINEFVRVIDRKLRSELANKLRNKFCADESLCMKNSYYCVATLCPCMAKTYSLEGPLVLGPFNCVSANGNKNVRGSTPAVCEQWDDAPSVCGSDETVDSFRYSACTNKSDSICDSIDSFNDVGLSGTVCTQSYQRPSTNRPAEGVCGVNEEPCEKYEERPLPDKCTCYERNAVKVCKRVDDPKVCQRYPKETVCFSPTRSNAPEEFTICERPKAKKQKQPCTCGQPKPETPACRSEGQQGLASCRSDSSTCMSIVKTCKIRRPVVLDHCNSYTVCADRKAEKCLESRYSKRSERVAKWGKCYEVVDSVLNERDNRMRDSNVLKELGLEGNSVEQKERSCKRNTEEKNEDREYLLTHVCGIDEECKPKLHHCVRNDTNDDDNFEKLCGRPSHTCRVGFDGTCVTGDDFDDLQRFHDIGSYGFAKLVRKVVKWTHCISKNWNTVRNHPHIVVHLPSLSYSNDLRCRARKTFDYLQNIQVSETLSSYGIARTVAATVGFCHGHFVQLESEELFTLIVDLVSSIRPDVDVASRLWLVQPKPKCVLKRCVSGSENLFFSPESYRRVRHLTAGRHAFILPGVMDQKDIFIACELKIPIMGPQMKFQKKLLSKSYVMELLDVSKIPHPPFIHVHSFAQLCRGLAIMALRYTAHKTWFIKIDNGFSGYQTAIVHFKKGLISCAIRNVKRTFNLDEDFLTKLLVERLPYEIQVEKDVYKNSQEFFHDLEKHGGIIQAAPKYDYTVLSLGVFIEHDLARPILLVAAEVIHLGSNIRNDMAYTLPQTKVNIRLLEELVEQLGVILRNEHVLGYFGIDVVTFRNRFDVEQLWVIDVDPYYTDLIAFSDWVKFAIGPCEHCNERNLDENIENGSVANLQFSNINKLLNNASKYVVCCGKLFGTGLSKYCGFTLLSLCKQSHIFYDSKEKIGCMVYPTDSHNRAISIVSINSTKSLAMSKFVDALKVLNRLSVHKTNCGNVLADSTVFKDYLKTIE